MIASREPPARRRIILEAQGAAASRTLVAAVAELAAALGASIAIERNEKGPARLRVPGLHDRPAPANQPRQAGVSPMISRT